MSWLKIDDGFAEHPKIHELADRTFRLHVVALCYCARNLTDGIVTERSLRVIAAIIGASRVTRNVDELVNAGLWVPCADGYTIKDYLDYNPSSQKVREERNKAKERMARGRAKAAGNPVENVSYALILERDGHMCHICGRGVDPGEVSFDHVIPLDAGGSHSEDNIKVAHLQCNWKKNKHVRDEFARSSPEQPANSQRTRSPSPSRPSPVPVDSESQGLSVREIDSAVSALVGACSDADARTEQTFSKQLASLDLIDAEYVLRLADQVQGSSKGAGWALNALKKEQMRRLTDAVDLRVVEGAA